MATLFMDFANGNDANAGTSFALRVKTITTGATAARHAAGDTWRIMKSEDPVSLGINATFTNLSDSVTLASSLTKNITNCDGAWTAVSANVVQSNPTARKEGTASIQFAVAAAFTTGQIGYLTMASTDFSAYKKISFWIKTSLTLAASTLSISLCSDTVGATPVNTITITDPISSSGSWRCVTVDTGGALSAAIQSISLNALLDPGAANIGLDNILACNDLTLTSLISLNSSSTSLEWYPIKSINGTAVKLDQGTALDGASTGRGFFGTTTTATCYKIEPIPVTLAQTIQKAGTNDTTRITYSGGWDTTAMTSQTGLTFLDWRDSAPINLTCSQVDISFDHIVFVRGSVGLQANSNEVNFDNLGFIDTGSTCLSSSGLRNKLTNLAAYNNAGTLNPAGHYSYINNITANNSSTAGIQLSCANSISLNTSTNNNTTNGLTLAANCVNTKSFLATSKNNGSSGASSSAGSDAEIIGITTSGNASTGITASQGSLLRVDNTNCTDSTPFSAITGGRLQISRIGDDPTSFRIYDSSSTICQQYDTGTVHGSASKSLKHSPQAVHLANFPNIQVFELLPILGIAKVTISIWVQRSVTTIGAQIVVRGGYVDGASSDTIATAAASANTWEQLTITLSPTQAVPVQIELQSWQISTGGNVFFGDMTINQYAYAPGTHKIIPLNLLDFNLYGNPIIQNIVSLAPNPSLRSYLGRRTRT